MSPDNKKDRIWNEARHRAFHLAADTALIVFAALAFLDPERYRFFLPAALLLAAALAFSGARGRLSGREFGRVRPGAGIFWLLLSIFLFLFGFLSVVKLVWG